MVEEQDLSGRLQEIDGEVVAADVGELVRDDGIEMRGREARQGAGGQQDHRAQPPHDRRHLHAGRLHDADRTRDGQALGELAGAGDHGLGHRQERARRTRSTHSQASARRSDRPQTPSSHTGTRAIDQLSRR